MKPPSSPSGARPALVDVFVADAGGGNPLAVVRDGASIPDGAMQALARELDLSETVFVIAEDEAGATLRIFTPVEELPFAGHPVLGTAWLLREGRSQVRLRVPAGDVEVRFEADGADSLGWFRPPPPQSGGAFDAGIAACLLGLAPDELHASMPVRLMALGPRFLFVPLAGPDALARAKPDLALHDDLIAQGHPVAFVFAFCPLPVNEGADYRARMWFRTPALREDPATGSANACFAAYLHEHRRAPVSVVVEQGVEMGRPCRLHLRTDADGVEVGGRVRHAGSG